MMNMDEKLIQIETLLAQLLDLVQEMRKQVTKPTFDPLLYKSIQAFSVDNCPLSRRLIGTLSGMGIGFVGDLVQRREAELLEYPGFGKTSLNEVKEALASVGLGLGTRLEGWPAQA